MRIVLLCLLINSAAWPRIASADPITIFLDGRQAIAGTTVRDNAGQDRHDVQVLPGGGSAAALVMSPDGHAASATATLASSVSDPHHMSGSGVGSATATVPLNNQLGLSQAQSLSQFNLFFLLDAPHAFNFSGLFTGTDSINTPQIFSSRTWGASLFFISSTNSFTVFEHRNTLSTGTDGIRRKGVLQPGEYQIFVEHILSEEIHQPGATIASGGEFGFTFDLTPSPVPEPATFLLLGSGLLGLLRLQRQRT